MAGRFSEYSDLKEIRGSLIPESWGLSKVKFIGQYLNGFAFKPTHWADEGRPIIRIQNLSNPASEINRTSYVAPERYKIIEGDILISWSATLEVFVWAGEDAWLNQHIFCVKVNEINTLRQYFYWAAKWFMRELNELSHGSTMQHLTTDKFGGFNVPLPSPAEQQKIANFLDHETAKIDTLIEKQQQLIKLLKEKRQAVITHAVTKGLNPNAPMRDSGVDWLGEVPAHWEVKQAKYVADITRGAILRPVDAPEYFDEEGEWAYLNISDATKCDKYLYKSKLYLSPLGSKKSARVYPDNVIITASATIGKAFINKIKVCVHDGFIPFCNLQVDKSYMYHYLSNPFLYAAMGKSNTQKNIYLDEVKNMVVTVPSNDEQLGIVNHIEQSAATFGDLIDKAEKAIELMQERRTALISAAVTGKIDVRNWVAQEPSNNKNKEVAV